MVRVSTRKRKPRGAAAVELALLLPMMCFICVAAIDFCRAFADAMTVSECVHVGALRGMLAPASTPLPTATIEAAALERAARLETPPEIVVRSGSDAAGTPYVEVEASYVIHPLFNYPGVPETISIVRTVRMRRTPS
ncbi:TadE/TadG family type IV pilus assembly protein [Paludisphaera soli]|uniref:TadE/TadG family type IV pilus assembly protein n=1 Tax=Paludisphaera soli TaxID=2712865 RepID=UPI0013E9C9CE|nr:TadE/TadG family type IV pilus assembly protein [Paludisphaera soli]